MADEPKIPKWRAYADELRQKIMDGEYPEGYKLLPHKKAAEEQGIHHETVRVAYGQLEGEGLIHSQKRTGTVVLGPPQRRRVPRGTTVTRDPQRGYIFPAAAHPGEPWEVHGQPFRKHVPAPLEVTNKFGLTPQALVLRRRRVTSPEGEPPFQLADTWISPSGEADAPRVADASPGPGGYIDRLEEAGHGPIEWSETVRAHTLSQEEADLLEIKKSAPALQTVIVGTSAKTEQPVEITVRVIPGDRVELTSQLVRGISAAWPTSPVVP